jgi:ribosome-interacting GTPase 1
MREEDDVPVGGVRKRMLIIINKCEGVDTDTMLTTVRDVIDEKMPMISVSAQSRLGIDDLKVQIYKIVEIVRVYTKIPGKKPDMKAPFVLKAGSTVMDLAKEIHHDFSDNLRFARVWGSARFEGQPVQRDYVLQDGDIIELHI